MGKTVKKNQQTRVRRTHGSGAFVVKGRKFELEQCNPASIAEFLRGKGYPAGTSVRYRGAQYKLESEQTATDVRYKLTMSL